MSGSSLDHFKTQLGQRVVGRTSVLDSVLSPLEDQSHRLKMDLEYISSIDIEEKSDFTIVDYALLLTDYPGVWWIVSYRFTTTTRKKLA
jgi:hypothetical protein